MEKVCVTCRWSVSTDEGCYCLPRDEHQHPEHWCRFWEEGIDDPAISKKEENQNGTDTGKP